MLLHSLDQAHSLPGPAGAGAPALAHLNGLARGGVRRYTRHVSVAMSAEVLQDGHSCVTQWDGHHGIGHTHASWDNSGCCTCSSCTRAIGSPVGELAEPCKSRICLEMAAQARAPFPLPETLASLPLRWQSRSLGSLFGAGVTLDHKHDAHLITL